MDNLFYCNSQGRDQRICLWDLAEGRTSVTDSVFTEHVGFCRCSLLKVAQGRWLMAMAARSLEEVGSVSFSVLERLLLVLKWHRSEGETSVLLNSLLKSRQHKKPSGVLITNFTATRMTELYNSCFNNKDTSPRFVWSLHVGVLKTLLVLLNTGNKSPSGELMVSRSVLRWRCLSSIWSWTGFDEKRGGADDL